MGQDVWIRDDGVEMLGKFEPRRPGAHICTCWYHNVKQDKYEAMCGAERPWKPEEYVKFQILGLGHLPKPDDCEKCRVLFVKALLAGNIYHHSIHEEAKHTLTREQLKQERIKQLEEEIRILKSDEPSVQDLRLVLEKLPTLAT